jgi:large subunit ribosomal protein L15
MVTNKTRKVQKYRGHTTHGGGHRKKRRGSGSRGGVGNAGSGKRAGHKKNVLYKRGHIIGNSGFTPRRSKVNLKVVNLGYFTSERLNKLLAAGKIKKDGENYNVDLKVLGYNKLLSTGNLNDKVIFKVDTCSAKVEEKVKSAGGEVTSGKKEVSSEEKSKSIKVEQ